MKFSFDFKHFDPLNYVYIKKDHKKDQNKPLTLSNNEVIVT